MTLVSTCFHFSEMNWSYLIADLSWSQGAWGKNTTLRSPISCQDASGVSDLRWPSCQISSPKFRVHEGRQVNFLCHFLKTRQLLVPPPRTLHLQSHIAPFMMTTVFQKASLKLSGASKSALCGKFTSLAFLGSCNFGPSLRQIRFRWCLNMFDGYDDECQERSIRNASVRCFSWTGWKQGKGQRGSGWHGNMSQQWKRLQNFTTGDVSVSLWIILFEPTLHICNHPQIPTKCDSLNITVGTPKGRTRQEFKSI